MYALARQRNICLEKMIYKLGIVITAMLVFSGSGMQLNADESYNLVSQSASGCLVFPFNPSPISARFSPYIHRGFYLPESIRPEIHSSSPSYNPLENTAEYIIKYYIHENIMQKEQSNALFLLKQKWLSDLEEKYKNREIKEIADGIIYVQMNKTINSRKIKINVAEVNRNINPDIEIIPGMASENLQSRTRINKIAAGSKVAVNGTYFKQDTGVPLGTLVIDNEIITGPIYERVAFGINDTEFKTSITTFEGCIKKGERVIKLDNINQPRMLFSHVLIYTPVWGMKSPLTKSESRHIAVSNNIVTGISSNPLDIPKDGYVITAPKNVVKGIKKGDVLKTEYKLSPGLENMKHIISGGPYLIKGGNIYVDTANQKFNGITGRNPRTAIGYTKDNVLIMVTVDGRKEGSSGVTLNELAKILKDLGCYEAINLDGGSSTVMYVDGNILSGSNLKNSSAISNALTVRIKA